MSRDLTLTINIVPAPTTTLARIATAMLPKSWVQLDGVTRTVGSTPNVACTIPENMATIIGSNDPTNVGHIYWQSPPTVYANKANWNEKSKCIEIVGRYHGSPNAPYARYARYIESNHSFDCRYYDGDNSPISHNFDHCTVNPYTGLNYVRNVYNPDFAVFASGGDMFTAEHNPAISCPVIPQNNTNWGPNGVDWWSGPMTGAGVQGCLILNVINDDTQYGPGRPCHLARYDPVANAWLSPIVLPTYGDTDRSSARYNSQLVYSRTKNLAAVFGGHQEPLHWWRINANATCDGPFDAPIEVKHTSSHIHEDPVTGNFIVHSRFGFYELNPTNNVWTNINGANGYPARPTNVNYNTSSNGFPGITVTSLYEHGVLAYISSDGYYVARMHLYKHG